MLVQNGLAEIQLDPKGTSFVNSSSTDVRLKVSSLVLIELIFPLLCEGPALSCFLRTRLKVADSA